MRIAFVVQRYGLEVNGGAELHCRQVAEHLSKYYDVEALTTCAIDYMTWKNEYPQGEEIVNNVKVHRFPVDWTRNVELFNKESEKIFFNQSHTIDDETEWMKLQGPYSTKLFSYIKENKSYYDYFIFFTYLYCTTYFGLPLVKDKAILVPTAHDELPIYLNIFNKVFTEPKAILYNTEEEKKFINSMFNNINVLSDIAGVGILIPERLDSADFLRSNGIKDDFIIYIGRIDESKGCNELFKYFLKYKSETQSNLKLVLIGKAVINIPNNRDIIQLGFVSDEDKFKAIYASKLLIVPSKYESLSMVLLEAWACEKPSLVNGECKVLKTHCLKSNAGLWYENYQEFRECLNYLLTESSVGEKMGKNGRRYVQENYNWNTIINKYIALLKPR